MDLDLYFSFGLNYEIQRNATFYDDQHLLFAAGQTSVLFNLDTKLQKRLPIADGPDITSIGRCGSHIALTVKGRPPSMCLYNIASDHKRVYTGVEGLDYDDFVGTAPSSSRKFIAGQGNGPDWPLVIWHAVSREIVATLRPTLGRQECLVRDISFFGGDRDEVVVVGKNVFRLFEHVPVASEGECPFAEVPFEKYELNDEYFSTAWPQKENLAVSTRSGKVMFFRGIELIKEMSVAGDVEVALLELEEVAGLSSFEGPVSEVACGPDVLLCVVAGIAVAIYKGAELSEYVLNKVVLMPNFKKSKGFPGLMEIPEDLITHFDFRNVTNAAMATTANAQLLYVKLEEDKKVQYFVSLLQRQHTEPILSMGVARGRPTVLTCSEHRAILWNLETRQQEVLVAFRDKILCGAIHPSGLYVAVSFSHYTRICTVLSDGFRDYKMLDTKACTSISFSFGGHLMAFAQGSVLRVYSFTTLERVARLDGHADRITCVAWKNDDTRLVSCDAKGVLCEWDVLAGRKDWENTCIATYSHVAFDEGDGVFVAGSNGLLKCVENANVRWDVEAGNELTTLALDGKTLYAGGKDGSVGRYVVPDFSRFAQMRAHKGEVIEMAFVPDRSVLLTAASDGLLLGWRIAGDVPAEPLRIAFVEASQVDMQRDRMELLEMSIRQCNVTYECALKLNRLHHTEAMREASRRHEGEVAAINDAIGDTKEGVEFALFDTASSEELKRLEEAKSERLIEQLQELDAAYKHTSAFAAGNQKMASETRERLQAQDRENARAWALEIEGEEALLLRTKTLREGIRAETEATEGKRAELQQRTRDSVEGAKTRVREGKKTERDRLQAEKDDLQRLEKVARETQYLTFLVREDADRKRSTNAGKIARDVAEKTVCNGVLKSDLQHLEECVQQRQRAIVGLEAGYFHVRNRVGDLRRRRNISNHNVDALRTEIAAVRETTAKDRREEERVEGLLPHLRERLRVATEQCATLETKLRGTVGGCGDQVRLLRQDENFIANYKHHLHEIVSKDCNASALRDRIQNLFSQTKRHLDEGEDPRLASEFAHQTRALADIYRNIMKDPGRTMEDQAVADLRLCRESMRVLQESHEVQRAQAALTAKIADMEVAMGMPVVGGKVKMTPEVMELRDRIELVVTAAMEDGGEEEMKGLDQVIVKQQEEVERLRWKMLLEGVRRKKKKKKEEEKEEKEEKDEVVEVEDRNDEEDGVELEDGDDGEMEGWDADVEGTEDGYAGGMDDQDLDF